MIFVCVGSREYQFNRLLEKIDELVERKLLTDDIFAQIGQSTYIPKNYEYIRFMDENDFKEHQKKADLIISHGGTGALIGALKFEKQVIAVPRLEKYGEHIDNHQTQVAGVLAEEGYLKCVLEMDELTVKINEIKERKITKKYNKPSEVVNIIKGFIENDKKLKGKDNG